MLGYSFRQAKSEADRGLAGKLRYRIYSQEGYINPLDHPREEMVDKYAPFSEDFVAFFRSRPVGTIRITKDSEHGFPTENLFNIGRLDERQSVLEIGRLVIDPGYRQKKKGNRLIMFGLAYLVFLHSLRSDIQHWVVNMPEGLARSFEQFGACFEQLHQDEPTESHIKARSIIAGYFKRYDLLPYKIDISAVVRKGRTKITK
jgi:hypothetical protein